MANISVGSTSGTSTGRPTWNLASHSWRSWSTITSILAHIVRWGLI